MFDLLTNRETALGISFVVLWSLIVIASARRDSNLGSLFIEVIKAATCHKILVALALFLGTIGIAIGVAHRIGLWVPTLTRSTVIWVVITGGGLFYRMGKNEQSFFRDTLKQTVAIAVVVEFVANLESFSLWIEITTQLFAGVLGLLTMPVKDSEKQHAGLRKFANFYYLMLGSVAIIWAVWKMEWRTANYGELALEFALPIWLSAVAVLYLYLLSIFAIHETTSVRMRIYSRKHHHTRRYRMKMVAIILRSGLSRRSAQTIGKRSGYIAEATGFGMAWRIASRSIREDRARAENKVALQQRLINNAGSTGTYMSGKQRDQREHTETKKALQWIATCQMGHYRNHPHRYLNNKIFLSIVESASKKHGLPTPTDIKLHVSEDGQSWYAERETITGHWFAIGAAEKAPDQWFYDGSTRPRGFPNEHEWDQWGYGEHSMNWNTL